MFLQILRKKCQSITLVDVTVSKFVTGFFFLWGHKL